MSIKKEDAKLTDSTPKEVSAAHHQAKDDAMKSGELPERQANKVDQANEKLADDAFNGGNKSK